MRNDDRPPTHLFRRAGLLLALLCLVDFWFQRHLGIGVIAGISSAGFVALLAGAFKFLPAVFKREERRLARGTREAARFALSDGILALLSTVVLVAGSTASSVTVLAGDVDGKREVHLEGDEPELPSGKKRLVDQDELAGANGVVRFLLFTNPFGRPLAVDVAGYRRHSFELWPWIGARILVGRDLHIAPSLLVRVPFGMHSLLSDAHIELQLVPDPNSAAPAGWNTSPLGAHGAALFGPARPIPDTSITRWERELRVAANRDERAVDEGVLRWLDPLECPLAEPLREGMRIRALLRGRDEKESASREFTVTADAFQDVVLEIPPESRP